MLQLLERKNIGMLQLLERNSFSNEYSQDIKPKYILTFP